jgi:hypothetical protein
MAKWWWVGAVASVFIVSPALAMPDLTATERTWLEAALPVLSFARELRLPLDIIVRPEPTPGETPMGLAFIDGRCKLVLSMRGNAEAQATLDRMPQDLVSPIVESLAAHELGHCWRHLQKDWGSLPSGVHAVPLGGSLTDEQALLLSEMWRSRREEAFADLVGLAWTLQHHRDSFGAVHAWYARLRSVQVVDTGPHDTRLWVQMASDPARFTPTASVFDQAMPLWIAGLLAEH